MVDKIKKFMVYNNRRNLDQMNIISDSIKSGGGGLGGVRMVQTRHYFWGCCIDHFNKTTSL